MKTRPMKIPALAIMMVLQAAWAIYLPAQQSFTANSDRRTSPPAIDSVTPVMVFEQVWNFLNDNYPYFGQRGIDWKAVHTVYGGMVKENSKEDIEAGHDKVLELAVGLVKAGGSNGKDARGILVKAPFSLRVLISFPNYR